MTDKMTASVPLVMRLVRTYVRPQLAKICRATAMMLLSAAMTAAMAKLMEPIIDKVFSDKNPTALLYVGATVFAVFVVRGLATYGQTVLMNELGQRIVADMQNDMFSHLVYADTAYFHHNDQNSGHLQARFISDTLMIRSALNDSLAGLGKNLFTLIFLVSVMVAQDWKLSLLALISFPLAAAVVAKMGKKLRKVSTSMQVEVGQLTGMLGQAFQGNKHIKAYGMEEFEKTRVRTTVESIYRLLCKSFRVSAFATPLNEILSGIAVVAIVIYGGHQVILGATTAGKLFSFITAFLMAFEPMKRLAKLNSTTQMGLAAADRMFKMLDTLPHIQNKPDAAALELRNPTVSFDNVYFTYADGSEALRGVSFEVPAGKTVALVGESGAGKSTILNLIPRFFEVTGGAIRVDGKDVRDITMASLRANMALVSQEVSIFNDTVGDNIRYGAPGASQEQVEAAARSAVAHDFIMELPQGYDTMVGENGVKLSGGQRQRIAIARAMLRNAPILLLDEATSALDANSERLVQTALERLQQGKTTIVVAHRLSTIMNADVIFVMDDGRIIETGNHAALMAKGGIYARLYGTMMKESA